jgi:hypothetical protein
LVSELERDFRQQSHVWKKLARKTPMPSLEQVAEYAKRSPSAGERRAAARIVQTLPNAIDLYDKLIVEIGRRPNGDVENKKLVRAAGRERVEAWLEAAIEAQQISSFVDGRSGAMVIPRDLFELIEPKLREFEATRKPPGVRHSVGRKPA